MPIEPLPILIEDDLDDRVLIAHTSREGRALPHALVAVDSCDAFKAASSSGGSDIIASVDRPAGKPW